MNVDLGIWSKLSRLLLVLLVLATLVVVALWYVPLIRNNESLRKRKFLLEQQIKQAEEEQKRLKSSLYSLEHDPKTLERMAREKLGYAKTNETVIRFESSVPNASARR